jgi:hypothetical protein
MWDVGKNLRCDFAFAIKFPYYNEYKRSGQDKVAVGLDEQVVCFNFSLYYTLELDRYPTEKAFKQLFPSVICIVHKDLINF